MTGISATVKAFSTRESAIAAMEEWYNYTMLEMLENAGCAGITGEKFEEFFEAHEFTKNYAVLSDGYDYYYWQIDEQEVK